MEFFVQKMSESNRTKAAVSVVLGFMSLVVLLLAFHMNFRQHEGVALSGSVTPPAFSAEISE